MFFRRSERRVDGRLEKTEGFFWRAIMGGQFQMIPRPVNSPKKLKIFVRFRPTRWFQARSALIITESKEIKSLEPKTPGGPQGLQMFSVLKFYFLARSPGKVFLEIPMDLQKRPQDRVFHKSKLNFPTNFIASAFLRTVRT